MDGTAANYMAGNLLLNTTTDAGFRLDVNGTARVQGNTTISLNQNAETICVVQNTTSGTGAGSKFRLISDGGFEASIAKFSSGYTPYKSIGANDFVIYNTGAGNLTILNDKSGQNINFTTGGASTAQLTLRADGDLALGTTTFGTATKFTLGGSETASSAIARGGLINTTLVAAANNDVLVGLDINPTFTNGAFTGVTNTALRVTGRATFSTNVLIGSNSVLGINTNDGADSAYLAICGASQDGVDRGGHIYLSGNERVADPGSVVISTGNVTSGTGAVAGTVFRNAGTESMRIVGNTRNVLIGTNTDAGFRLDVNGTARVQGQQTILVANAALGFLLTQGSGIAEIRGYPSGSNTRFELQSQSVQAVIGLDVTANIFNLLNNTGGGVTRLGNNIASGGGVEIYADINSTARDITFFNGRPASRAEQARLFTATGNFGLNAANTDIPSAILFANSTTKGFLPPRMTTTQRTAISSPAAGLVVYDTTDNEIDYYNGTAWQSLMTLGTQQTITGFKQFSASRTASLGVAQGTLMTPTLTASANNDVLVGLDISPTYTNGAFTGVTNSALRLNNSSASGVWNLYASGTANNYMAGKLLIGTTTDNGQGTLQNTGSAFLGGLQVGGLTFSTSTTATTSTIFYYFNGGSGQTLTLPSTVGISSYFLIKNAGTADLTISRSGSTDTIMAPNGTSTSTTISLAAGSQAILVSNGAFVWIQIV
jgi:hypothetical protein